MYSLYCILISLPIIFNPNTHNNGSGPCITPSPKVELLDLSHYKLKGKVKQLVLAKEGEHPFVDPNNDVFLFDKKGLLMEQFKERKHNKVKLFHRLIQRNKKGLIIEKREIQWKTKPFSYDNPNYYKEFDTTENVTTFYYNKNQLTSSVLKRSKNGKPSFIETKKYEYSEKGCLIKEEEESLGLALELDKRIKNHNYKYNDQNQIIEFHYLELNNDKINNESKTSFSYKDGVLFTENNFKKNKLKDRRIYRYLPEKTEIVILTPWRNAEGFDTSLQIKHNDGSSVYWSPHEKSGFKISEYYGKHHIQDLPENKDYYNPSAEPRFEVETVYSKDTGQKIYLRRFNEKKLESETTWDEDGFMISEMKVKHREEEGKQTFKVEKILERYSEKKYDEEGNWIEKLMISPHPNGIVVEEIIKRKIEYYN